MWDPSSSGTPLDMTEIYYRPYTDAQAHKDVMRSMKGPIDHAAGVPLVHLRSIPEAPRKLTLCGPANARRWGQPGAPDM